MLRLSVSGIAAATLLLCFESAPVNAQNGSEVGARWGYNSNGFFNNGPKLTGVRGFAVSPPPRHAAGAGNNGRYNVFRDRSGFGLRQGPTINSGWGCPACGFKNGPRLSGLREPAMHGLSVTAVTLPSGEIIDLR